jgi:hypothetical protein
MANNRDDSAEGDGAPIMAAETLRPKSEEPFSPFWRIFGATILSIAALVAITVCQYFNNSLAGLRKDLNRLAESSADLLKKDEYNLRMKSVWDVIKDDQAEKAKVSALVERCAFLQQRQKELQDELKKSMLELQRLRERLATVEGRQGGKP